MRYGYYLAQRREEHGDPDLSCEAAGAWDRLAGGFERPGHFDGVSIYQRDDGTWAKVLIVEDFFAETFKVLVHDLLRPIRGETTEKE